MVLTASGATMDEDTERAIDLSNWVIIEYVEKASVFVMTEAFSMHLVLLAGAIEVFVN